MVPAFNEEKVLHEERSLRQDKMVPKPQQHPARSFPCAFRSGSFGWQGALRPFVPDFGAAPFFNVAQFGRVLCMLIGLENKRVLVQYKRLHFEGDAHCPAPACRLNRGGI
jgi:hypothetical protein